MTIRITGGAAILALCGMLSGIPAVAQNSPAPDNTKVNKGDRSAGAPTADQAKNNKSDREIMKEIRKSIQEDKSLSSYGHNVKVIAQSGQVTLKGPAHSEEERKSIESKATEVAGAGNVTNQMTVKEEKSK
ncbi:MAG TPA: BON domain-containing protein [Bryobacteraceae bacterium]|nr:BON domain-containing protein [Bryobacteraceae bacterium]